ncbi:MAG: MATE family efflux transporter [Allorhizobium sp.]
MQNHYPISNPFLNGWLPGVFAKTAIPIIAVMLVNGLFVVVDAYFLATYAGPDALSAVTLIFPCLMMVLALQTLVATGMASLLARKLGGGERTGARQTFFSAHLLALGVVVLLYSLFWLFGAVLINSAAGGDTPVAAQARRFMSITVAFAPIAFFLSIHLDALRCEGRVGIMALITIVSALLNMLANWLLIAVFHWGVAGSAFGSVLAQALCLATICLYRLRHRDALRPAPVRMSAEWLRMLALGAPMSLGFLGISLASATVIYNLSIWQTDHFIETIAAYGIVTRVLTVAYLPLMGISLALQTICGNNFGAGLTDRVARSLAIALLTALFYCAAIEVLAWSLAAYIARLFVTDPLIIAEVVRILPWTVAVYFLFGQMLVLSGYFQALGDAARAALFGLSRPYALTIPLTFALPLAYGEPGIWMVAVFAEAGMVMMAAIVLAGGARRHGWRFGLLRG